MEEQKQTFNWVRLLIVSALVVFAAGAVGGTTYYVLNSNFQKEREANEKALNAVTEQVKKLEEKTKTTATTTTTTPTAANADLWKTYQNTKYGYQLTFPEDWKGYKALEKTNDFGTFSTTTWYFELPTTDPNWQTASSTNDAGYASLFAVSVFTKAQWQTVQAEEGPKPSKLGETANYVFGYSHAQAGTSQLAAQNAEINSIIASFKAI